MSNKNIMFSILGVLSFVVLLQGYMLYALNEKLDKEYIPSLSKEKAMPTVQHTVDQFRNFTTQQQWNPFEEMDRIQSEMQKVFGNFNSHFMNDPIFNSSFKSIRHTPLSDIQDKGKYYLITMNLPGAQEENVQIDTKDNYLNISARVQQFIEDNTSSYIRKERYIQNFRRSFILPDDANGMKLEHTYKNGILDIKVPKNK